MSSFRYALLIPFILCASITFAQTQPTTGASATPSDLLKGIVADLKSSDPSRRYEALTRIDKQRDLDLTDALVDALTKCAETTTPDVQRQLAITAGGRWVWSAKVQDPRIIALMRKLAANAEHEVRYNAVYYGLSTVRKYDEETIKAMLAAVAASHDSEMGGRVSWGLKRVAPEVLEPLFEPYWKDLETNVDDVWMMHQIYVDATGQEPPDPERFAPVKAKIDAKIAEQHAKNRTLLPKLKRDLLDGDSARRREALNLINRTWFLEQDLDDSLIDAFTAAAADPDAGVRAEVARTSGGRWVWGADKQNPQAIAIAMKLRTDSDPKVRYFAIWFGLSTVHEPSSDVISALLDTAIVRNESAERVTWGLKGAVNNSELATLMKPYLDDKDATIVDRAAKVYRTITGSAPAGAKLPLATKEADARQYQKTFRDFYDHLGSVYPCFEVKQIDWKQVGEELLPKSAEVKNDSDFGKLCLELVAKLQDSHAQLLEGTAKFPQIDFPQWDPGFACMIDDRDRPVVYTIDKGSPADKAGLKIGDAIVSVNGKPAEQAMKAWENDATKYTGYSSARALRYDAAKMFVRQMKRGDKVRIVTESADGAQSGFEVPATVGVRYLPRLPVPIQGVDDSGSVEPRHLNNDVGYIYVRRINGDLIDGLDRAVRLLHNTKGIIIDVRGNSGGGFDAERSFRNFDLDDKEESDRPRYVGKIALLLDERCISAGEGWASWFIAKKRAKTFGSTTSGASSRKEEYTLTNGLYKVIVPVKAYTGFLDRPIERRGLEPDVPVRINAKDLARGKDTVLESAKKWLMTSDEASK